MRARFPNGDARWSAIGVNDRNVTRLGDKRHCRWYARHGVGAVQDERRTARGGKDSIDRAPNAHDDLANSVAGVVAALASSAHGYDSSMKWVDGPEPGQGLSLWQHPYFNGGRSRW